MAVTTVSMVRRTYGACTGVRPAGQAMPATPTVPGQTAENVWSTNMGLKSAHGKFLASISFCININFRLFIYGFTFYLEVKY